MILTQEGGRHIVSGGDKVEIGKAGPKGHMAMNLLQSGFLSGCLAILFVLDFGPTAAAQTAEQLLQSIPGQLLILRGYGHNSEARISKDNPDNHKRGCDAAVEVRKARFNKGIIEVWLEDVGTPVFQDKSYKGCTAPGLQTKLRISGLRENDPPSALEEILNKTLQTPEAYLSAEGVAFNLPAESSVVPEVDLTSRDKKSPGVTPPHPLLIGTAEYSQGARREKVQGSVIVRCDIGTDGRPHNEEILSSVDKSLDQATLRAISLDRFEPAQKDGHAVAARVKIEMSFRLF
jgi:TonB family protein